jgi:hypothetical protein
VRRLCYELLDDLRSISSPRTAAVKHARRAPPKAARSVLDGREHGGIIAEVGRHVPEVRAVYARVFTVANRYKWSAVPVHQIGMSRPVKSHVRHLRLSTGLPG